MLRLFIILSLLCWTLLDALGQDNTLTFTVRRTALKVPSTESVMVAVPNLSNANGMTISSVIKTVPGKTTNRYIPGVTCEIVRMRICVEAPDGWQQTKMLKGQTTLDLLSDFVNYPVGTIIRLDQIQIIDATGKVFDIPDVEFAPTSEQDLKRIERSLQKIMN